MSLTNTSSILSWKVMQLINLCKSGIKRQETKKKGSALLPTVILVTLEKKTK